MQSQKTMQVDEVKGNLERKRLDYGSQPTAAAAWA